MLSDLYKQKATKFGGMHTYVIKLKKTQEVANTACKITEKVGGYWKGKHRKHQRYLSWRHQLCGSEATSNVKGTASPMRCSCQTYLIVIESSLWFLLSSRCRKIRGWRNQLSSTVRKPSNKSRMWPRKGSGPTTSTNQCIWEEEGEGAIILDKEGCSWLGLVLNKPDMQTMWGTAEEI